MKRFLLGIAVVLLIIDSNLLGAQHINWNSAPQTGFVFQITNREAQKLLTKSRPDTIINSLLHTQIDTFNVTKGWLNRPEKGHFILARIIENKLHCEYASVFPYQVLLLKEYNALSLQVLDLDGNVRDDAKVKFKTRRIRFDPESNTYRVENEWFNAASKIVTVELDGFRSVFNVDKHEVPYWSNDYYNNNRGPDFYSYMITDKNKYKPGEKVRFKSYALTGSRNPIRQDLEVWLIKSGRSVKVGTVEPHRPGSFAGEMELHDSLQLTLDQHYRLQLMDKRGRVVANCNFKYEDYELKGNRLKVELETPKHYYPSPNVVSIHATNENGLTLKDAKATIVILTDNIRETFKPLIILPDTLMTKTIQLEGEGSTRVEIPSSLFGQTNTSYWVKVAVLNSQKQRMEAMVTASHYFSQYELTASFSNDSIIYRVLDNGVEMEELPMEVFRDGGLRSEHITFPYREKINPAALSIRFESKQVSRTIRMADMLPRIKLIGGIEKDSFNIHIDNPQQIQVSWFVYQGSTLLEKGSGTDVDFHSKIEDRSMTYYAELLYSYAGSDRIITQDFPFQKAALDITLQVPDRIYPGQHVNALIEVKDEEGNAVSGVDLTAWATTAKLSYYPPDLPYYGGTSYSRWDKATYSKNRMDKHTAVLDLDYHKWASKTGLDTMKYYQFTYPGNEAFFYQVTSDDSTQFSPYVMQDGIAKRIYVIEVDRVPVYYSWTDQPKAYSFYVEPNKTKQITLRLYDRVLILDSLYFDKGMKTIVSIDLDHLPEGVSVHPIIPKIIKIKRRPIKKWEFTPTEISRLNTYLAAFVKTSYPSYLVSGKQFVPLSHGDNRGTGFIVGPIIPGNQTYVEHQKNQITYWHEGKFSYAFDDNVVYKLNPPKLIPEALVDGSFRPMTTINDMAINLKSFLEPKVYKNTWHPSLIDLVDHLCRVKILLPAEEARSGVNHVLFQHCETDSIAWPCKSYNAKPDYFTIPRGCHHIIILYNNGTYLKMESVDFKSNRNVVADMKYQRLHATDSISQTWLKTEIVNCYGAEPPTTRTITLTRPRHFVSMGNVQGTLFDETNMPLPGATVLIKGTTIGATSDMNGHFYLDLPADLSTLIISFIGYVTKEIEVSPGSDMSIVMEPDVQQLQEVVVIGYGEMKRRDMTSAMSVLQGRVAGVTISNPSFNDEDEDTDNLEQEEIQEAEQQLYQELLTLKNIRSQFSDVAFWEPRLHTDRHGQASFEVTFPDDITRWDAVVYGMNRRLQTGTTRKSIKSYKPIMAELHVPQFLTMGDSLELLGKVVNYSSDSLITGKTEWNENILIGNNITFKDYHTDKLPVLVTSLDTLTTRYSFTRNDGYYDGEERKVPVIPQGTIRADGSLTTLKNGDEIRIKSSKQTATQVEIFDNQLDLYAGDAHYLIHYKYDCNEQLASKLLGLLSYKRIKQYEGESFKYDKDVNKIIQRLLKNQNSEFLWSWWDVSPNTSHWMSAHVLLALKEAKDAGYMVNLNLQNVKRKATYNFEFLRKVSLTDVQLVHALAVWNVDLDYKKYVHVLDSIIQYNDSASRANNKRYGYIHYSYLNEKLLLLEVRQIKSLSFNRDALLLYKKETVLNETYFADDRPSRYWYTGDLPNNAIAYRIIRRDSVMNYLTTSMQLYFLSLRRKGTWNTYESSNVLTSILPDLIADGSTKKSPATVTLQGKVNGNINKFPYTLQLNDAEELIIHKDAGLPLYCMQYAEARVTKASSGTDAFTIKTTFAQKSLKAGDPTVLKTIIEVKRDAKLEHVMIEIPIPAGCSYADKRQFDNRIETHREYFKEKTVVFCENMTPGTYVFQVQLLPRFTGKYHVNPAQVSLMYFPVINANTDMEKISIID